mgnify:FL=1
MSIFPEEKEDKLKLEVSTKAYKIDLSKIDEGYCYDQFEHTAHGETKGKAKTKLWNHDGKNMELNNGKEMTFLSLPVIRAKESDLYLFECKEVQENEIHRILSERQRLETIDSLMKDNDVRYCYIVKRGSYYGHNYSGYVYDKEKAGVYLKEDAKSHAFSCQGITLRAVDVEAHNSSLRKRIEYLEGCKIK